MLVAVGGIRSGPAHYRRHTLGFVCLDKWDKYTELDCPLLGSRCCMEHCSPRSCKDLHTMEDEHAVKLPHHRQNWNDLRKVTEYLELLVPLLLLSVLKTALLLTLVLALL